MNKEKEPLGRQPAGGRAKPAGEAAPGNEGQQAAGADAQGVIIVANERDRRTLAWLRSQVGDAAILAAVGQLAGSRKPYLSNVAKALGVALPAQLESADRNTALKHLADARKALSKT